MSAHPKPHFVQIAGRPVETRRRESPIEAARRRYGKPFCSETWAIGEGPRVFTAERVAVLAAQNDAIRKGRGK